MEDNRAGVRDPPSGTNGLPHEEVDRLPYKKTQDKEDAGQVCGASIELYCSAVYKTPRSDARRSIRSPLSIPAAEGEEAAKYIKFFNNLFGSCNSRKVRPESTYRVAVSKSNPHVRFGIAQ